MIKVEGLFHSYTNDEKYAVKDVDFQVNSVLSMNIREYGVFVT